MAADHRWREPNGCLAHVRIGRPIGRRDRRGTSVIASWFTQRLQVRSDWLIQDRLRRQDLYKEFIETATTCYIDALQHDKGDISALVTLYTEIARIRVLSPPKVIDCAEQIGRKILDTYTQPNKTFLELCEIVNGQVVDMRLNIQFR